MALQQSGSCCGRSEFQQTVKGDNVGEFLVEQLVDGKWLQVAPWKHNDTLYSSGYANVMALCKRDSNYGISALYLEFENVADPDDVVSTPTVELADQDYYDSLSASGVRDYLRIAITEAPHLYVVPGYELLLPAGHYNGAILYGQSAGVTGVHGKSFSAGSNSKVCGLAAVVAPEFTDPSEDIVYARAYYDSDEQWLKQENNQIRVSYKMKFVPA